MKYVNIAWYSDFSFKDPQLNILSLYTMPKSGSGSVSYGNSFNSTLIFLADEVEGRGDPGQVCKLCIAMCDRGKGLHVHTNPCIHLRAMIDIRGPLFIHTFVHWGSSNWRKGAA
jgi:hypothetical protein